MKSRRIAWLGDLDRMDDHWLSKKIMEWKHTAFRSRGRPKMRQEGDVKQHIEVTKILIAKSTLKVGLNGNFSLSRSNLIVLGLTRIRNLRSSFF